MKKIPVFLSLFVFLFVFSSAANAQILDNTAQAQHEGSMQLIKDLGKKLQKISDASSSCVEEVKKIGYFPDYCIRFHLALNQKLDEIFNDTQTRTDIETALYG